MRKSNLFGSCEGNLKDLREGEEQVSINKYPDALTLKYSETCHRTVILLYLAGAKKCHIVCAAGRGAKGGEVIINPNPLRQLVPVLFF